MNAILMSLVLISAPWHFGLEAGYSPKCHEVNFDLLLKRLASFKEEEKISLERYQAAVGGEDG